MSAADPGVGGLVRATGWVAFGHNGFSHYRIWMRQTPFGFYQRHQWRRDDGAEHFDGWIANASRGFPAHYAAATDPTPDAADLMKSALQQIADGHNDPRTLARETLEKA